jgi:hypothetical protein
VDLSSHWLAVGKNKPLVSHTTTERANRRQEQQLRTALKRGGFVGLVRRRGGGGCKGVLGRESTCERGQASDSQACGEGDEGAEVAEESQKIRVEASECPQRAYFVS